VSAFDPYQLNLAAWSRGEHVGDYANRTLRPVEVEILVRYRDELAGRVLELGSGAGRLLGYLGSIARTAQGLELSAAMIAEAHRRFPHLSCEQGDLRDLGRRYGEDAFDAVFASYNVLDVFGDEDRRGVLGEIRRILVPGGLFVLSSHNRASVGAIPPPTRLQGRDPLRRAVDALRIPRRLRNHRRLARLEFERPGYAIRNDPAHAYSLLHYYIDRDAQERQLHEAGFDLVECLDLDGATVPPGARAPASGELHYLARARGPVS